MNRQQQEEALEAAKLAAMVGGQLRVVDSLRSDNGGMPANRIDINAFVAKAKGQNVRFNQPAPVDRLQQKAMEDAMREAMAVPEPRSFVAPAPELIPMPTPPAQVSPAVASESLKNIEDKVEKIGNTLQTLLELIQTTLNQHE